MVVGPYSFEDSAILTAPRVAWTGPEQILDGAAVVDTESGEVTYRYDEPVSGPGWLRDHRVFARSAAGEVFRVIDAETGVAIQTYRHGPTGWSETAGPDFSPPHEGDGPTMRRMTFGTP